MKNWNLDKIENRFRQYWNKENFDRPLMSLIAPKNTTLFSHLKGPDTIMECWLDTDYVIKRTRAYIQSIYYAGEAFPSYFANLGPDIVGAIAGCDLEFGETTSWANHFVDDWENIEPLKFDENNKWFMKLSELTKAALDDSKGDYIVGITDLHPGADGLVSLRGPDNLCLDLYDNPQHVKKRINEIFEIHKEILLRQHTLISSKQHMCTNWTGIIDPDALWYVTSCDFSCMISKDDYEEFIIPGLMKELSLVDKSIYHLDGPGALLHLDRLLEINNLNGIQWVYGAGQPSAKHWIPILKKIQDAGKLIQIEIFPDDLKDLCEALEPNGVHFTCSVQSQQEADSLIKAAEQYYTDKRKKTITK